MSDLTSELQQMADDAARQARPMAADVIRRGDRRHRRSIARLSLGGLSATGAIAAVIIGVIALVPASHQASRQPQAQLAAWTVVKQAGGNIHVTIRQFGDPAGLQPEASRGWCPGQRHLHRPAESVLPAVPLPAGPSEEGRDCPP